MLDRWWTEQPINRRYFDVVLESGQNVVVFHDDEHGRGSPSAARREWSVDPAARANGKICYVEIPATDVEASAAFYEAVFGWRLRKRGDGATAFDARSER